MTIRLSRQRRSDLFVSSTSVGSLWSGPTLAQEKLLEQHDIRVATETLRQWMIDDGIWLTRRQRKKRVQQPRHRRDCRGELDNLTHVGGQSCRWTVSPAKLTVATGGASWRDANPGRVVRVGLWMTDLCR